MSTPVAPTSAPATATSTPAPSAPSGQLTGSAPAPTSKSPTGTSNTSTGSAPAAPSSRPGDIAAAAVAKATGTDAPATDPTRQQQVPADATPKTFKVKINGEVREMSEEQLVRYASLGGGADAKFQEAKQMRESAEQFVAALRSDPMSILTHPELGLNFRELAEQYLAKEIQREMLPPEQRELMELRAYREQQQQAAEQAQQQQMTQAQQRHMQQLQQQAAKEYDVQITDALNKSQLPRRPEVIREVAAEMHRALQLGYEIDVPTAVAMIDDRYNQTVRGTLGHLDGEALVKRLGDDIANKIRKYDIARLKARQSGGDVAQPQVAQPTNNAPAARRPEASKQMSEAEFREYIRKKAGV